MKLYNRQRMIKARYNFIVLIFIFFACAKKENVILPELDFSISKDTVLQGESISFSSSLKKGYSQLLWKFEGGIPSSSNDTSPTITYNSPGKYKVSLSVDIGNYTLLKDSFISIVSPKIFVYAKKDTVNWGDNVEFNIISENFYPTRFIVRTKSYYDNSIFESEFIKSTFDFYIIGAGMHSIDFIAIDNFGRTDSAKYNVFVIDDRIKIMGSLIFPDTYKIDYFVLSIKDTNRNDHSFLASIDTSHNYEVLIPRVYLGNYFGLEAGFGYTKVPNGNLEQLIIVNRFKIEEITYINWTLP